MVQPEYLNKMKKIDLEIDKYGKVTPTFGVEVGNYTMITKTVTDDLTEMKKLVKKCFPATL